MPDGRAGNTTTAERRRNAAGGRDGMSREQLRAAGWGLFWSGLLAVAIVVGPPSRRNIDAARVGYAFACLFAAFAIAYRYSIWLQRLPTRLYWRRGWQAFLKPGRLWANLKHLSGRFVR